MEENYTSKEVFRLFLLKDINVLLEDINAYLEFEDVSTIENDFLYDIVEVVGEYGDFIHAFGSIVKNLTKSEK